MPQNPPSRPSDRLLALTLASGLLACGASSRPPSYPTTDRHEEARRLPDGVALDPLSAPTPPTSRGESPSPGPVALRPPLPIEAAVGVLRRSLEAITQQDMAALQPLLAPRGAWLNPQSNTSAPLATHFRERIRRLDYGQLTGIPLIREADAEVYTADDLAGAPPGRPPRPQEMKPEDVLLKVRILTPRLGADRLFGDELLVLLRPEQGSYQILRWQEEFQIP